MIEIKCVDEQRALSVCERLRVPCGDVFEMTDRGQVIAAAVAVRQEETVSLAFLEAPDASLTDALLRAVLNAAQTKGAQTAQIEPLALREYAVKRKYLTNTDEKTLNIADFFAKSVCKG